MIAYDSTSGDDQPSTLHLVKPDGTQDRIVRWPVPNASQPKISPDGQWLEASTFGPDGPPFRPAVSRTDGSRFHRLVLPSIPDDADVGWCTWASNRLLLCEVRSPAGEIDGIYTIDPFGADRPVRLTVTPYPPEDDFGGGDLPGDVSPDGRRFVFMRAIPFGPPDDPGAPQSGALFVEDIDGTALHQITDWGVPNSHESGTSSWGAGRRGIPFGTERGRLATIQPDGTGLQELELDVATPYYAYAPVWAPAGNRFAFGMFSSLTRQSDIYIGTLHSGHVKHVTDTPEPDGSPDWQLVRR